MDDELIKGVLGERLLSEMQSMNELVSDIPRIVERLDRVETTLAGHTLDLREIKTLVIGHQEAIIELQAASHTH